MKHFVASGFLAASLAFATPVAAQDTIRFAVTDIDGLEALQQEMGPFKDAFEAASGLKVEFFPVSGRTVAVEAMAADQVDFVLTGPAEYARAGHQVTALDAAESAISATEAAAFAEALTVDCVQAPMTDLPFAAASFDHVLSWNVIYHGDETVVRRSLSEIARVLRPGGTFMATMLSTRRLPVEQAKAKGREISRNTWVFEGPGDKVHPHYFCTAPELLSLLWGFEVFTLYDRPHDKPGSWHWHLLAERLA